jgi:hypothetical protein
MVDDSFYLMVVFNLVKASEKIPPTIEVIEVDPQRFDQLYQVVLTEMP